MICPINVQDKSQVVIFSEIAHKFVTENKPAIVIDIFADELPLNASGFEHVNLAKR